MEFGVARNRLRFQAPIFELYLAGRNSLSILSEDGNLKKGEKNDKTMKICSYSLLVKKHTQEIPEYLFSDLPKILHT